MILDFIISGVCGFLNTILGLFMPMINFQLPVIDLSPFAGFINMLNQVMPLGLMVTLFGWTFGLKLAGLIWRGVSFLWDKIPVLGHGAI